MTQPVICLKCAKKSCKQCLVGELDVCDYGIAYCNYEGNILYKKTLVPLMMISKNLRHEMHKMLQAIIGEANQLDINLTTKHIDLENPASRIVGLSIAIDHFVQMLAGVNQFHSATSGFQESEKRCLSDIIQKYFAIHSIIRNERRSKDLSLELGFDTNLYISKHVDIFEYLISLLMDNAWKYSLPKTKVYVSTNIHNQESLDVTFINQSRKLPEEFDIFAKGSQADEGSEGFGYGLFWGLILVDHYNNLSQDIPCRLAFTHEEHLIDSNNAEQRFILSGIPIEIIS